MRVAARYGVNWLCGPGACACFLRAWAMCISRSLVFSLWVAYWVVRCGFFLIIVASALNV